VQLDRHPFRWFQPRDKGLSPHQLQALGAPPKRVHCGQVWESIEVPSLKLCHDSFDWWISSASDSKQHSSPLGSKISRAI
jgi:hypothetical protein